MSVYKFVVLFNLLLFLLLCNLFCEQVCANRKALLPAAENAVELFKTGPITGALNPNEQSRAEDIKVTVNDYHSLVFLSTSNFFVAMAGVNRTSEAEKDITVFTSYLNTKGNDNWKDKIFENDGNKWKKQFAAYDNCKTGCSGDSVVRGLAAAAKKNKIYLFLVNASINVPSDENSPLLDFRLVVGDVDITNDGKITWDMKEQQLASSEERPKVIKQIKAQKLSKSAFSGSALVKDKNIIFLLKVQTESKKTVFAFINLKDTGGANKLQFLPFNDIAEDCYPYVFSWESKIILIPTQCTGGVSNQKIKEITDVDKNDWTDSSEPFHIFVGFFNDKSDFTAANIKDTNKVLLFTQKIPKSQSQPPGNNDVYFWVTDGNHSYRAKQALTDVSDTPISLFYKDNELLALYQKWEATEPKQIVLRQLKAQLDDITTVIEAWKNTDEIVKKLCNDKMLCTTPPPTAGLVGFLHNTINEESTNIIWKDEYYFSNVTVKKVKAGNVTNGFKFSGSGKIAEWSMKNQQNEKPYNFIDFGFTLVATVTIDSSTNGKENSILGVKLTPNKKNVGLWCTRNGEWGVTVGDGQEKVPVTASNTKCEQGKTYNIALVFNKESKKNLEIYVNGEKLNGLTRELSRTTEKTEITHFYFGANNEGDMSYVTVTNVLLYNRPFDDTEIVKLKEYIETKKIVEHPDGNTQKQLNDYTAGGSEQPPTVPPTLPPVPNRREEKSPSPSRTEDGGVGGGVRVFFLLLAVLCVSAPLLHL